MFFANNLACDVPKGECAIEDEAAQRIRPSRRNIQHTSYRFGRVCQGVPCNLELKADAPSYPRKCKSNCLTIFWVNLHGILWFFSYHPSLRFHVYARQSKRILFSINSEEDRNIMATLILSIRSWPIRIDGKQRLLGFWLIDGHSYNFGSGTHGIFPPLYPQCSIEFGMDPKDSLMPAKLPLKSHRRVRNWSR